MARCDKLNHFKKPCGAHLLYLRDVETNELIGFDFIPSSSGDYIATEQGYCGRVSEREKMELREANVLFFKKHVCGEK